jgi:small conductance mechanosensitive channel
MPRKRLKNGPDLYLERMFETRTDAWEKVGLSASISQRAVRRARREAVVFVLLLTAVLVLYALRGEIFPEAADVWVRVATVILVAALGWGIARALGRLAAPTFFRRMDPSTAGTVGFVIRLVTVGVTLLAALRIARVSPSTLVAGSAFTAVIIGLAGQQTLGNLFAGMVLLSARPFRVGERVRLQAGAVGGTLEGIVSSLGLLYTTLARGDDRIQVPNNVVLAAAVVPIKEPEPVDVRVRLNAGISMTQMQQILDAQINTATRSPAAVLLEEIEGDEVVVRVQATPERADDGARLADEIIAALATVTGEHRPVTADSGLGE